MLKLYGFSATHANIESLAHDVPFLLTLCENMNYDVFDEFLRNIHPFLI